MTPQTRVPDDVTDQAGSIGESSRDNCGNREDASYDEEMHNSPSPLRDFVPLLFILSYFSFVVRYARIRLHVKRSRK